MQNDLQSGMIPPKIPNFIFNRNRVYYIISKRRKICFVFCQNESHLYLEWINYTFDVHRKKNIKCYSILHAFIFKIILHKTFKETPYEKQKNVVPKVRQLNRRRRNIKFLNIHEIRGPTRADTHAQRHSGTADTFIGFI